MKTTGKWIVRGLALLGLIHLASVFIRWLGRPNQEHGYETVGEGGES